MLPFKNLFEKTKRTSTEDVTAETLQVSEKSDWVNDALMNMMLEPRYIEYSRFINHNWKAISDGAHVATKDREFASVEEFVCTLYEETVVTPLIDGYIQYKDATNKAYDPLYNASIFILQSMALSHPDFSVGKIDGITKLDAYFAMARVLFYQKFDTYREIELHTGDITRTIIMSIMNECRRKIAMMESPNSRPISSAKELGIDEGYQEFVTYNTGLILEIHDALIDDYNQFAMTIGKTVIEMYDILIIAHLLRVADRDRIIRLTKENQCIYETELRKICLEYHLRWMPDNAVEKEILESFKKRIKEMAFMKVSKEFTDGVLNEVFGEMREYIKDYEGIFQEQILQNSCIINGNIENSITFSRAVGAIKKTCMEIFDTTSIGPKAISKELTGLGIDVSDKWELVLKISIPLYTTTKVLGEPEKLHEELLTRINAYAKTEHKTKDVLDSWLPVEKSWDEFRKTGLFMITNQFLHIFGWALVYNAETKRVKPCRVRYRGFSEDSVTRAYERVQKYMIENAETIYEESNYEEQDN